MKIITLFISLFIFFGCSQEKTALEKKAEVDDLYLKVKSIPASKPCENLEGYDQIQMLEEENGTNHYSRISAKKIRFYGKECEKYAIAYEREEKRLEELKKMGSWNTGIFVDEFGDPTNKKFLKITALGKFSNTATNNSDLRVDMFLDGDDISSPWFRLYEYNRSNPLKGYFDVHGYRCRGKDGGGRVKNFDLSLYRGGNSLRFSSKRQAKQFVELIENENSAKFSCYDIKNPSTKYFFQLDFKYYKNALRKLEE